MIIIPLKELPNIKVNSRGGYTITFHPCKHQHEGEGEGEGKDSNVCAIVEITNDSVVLHLVHSHLTRCKNEKGVAIEM